MKFLIQRVAHASVDVDGRTVGSIRKGYLVLIGICDKDTKKTADQYIARFTNENTADMNITVATSDGLIQLIIRGAGAYLLSATDLEAEIERANEELREKYDL